ncbi:MAG: helix-turn-helix domain-containing protein, partial [Thermoleophilaceae bacterium]
MTTIIGKLAARQVARRALAGFGADVQRLRTDAGIPRTQLAHTAGIDQSYLARIEKGTADPSSETCARIALALGADFSQRLYPNTGPAIRDRHQAPITEALLAVTHPRWHRFAEVAVRHPARGWIDLALHDPRQELLVATEIQSDLRRLEQLIRWSTAKAESLPSWEGWTHLGQVTVSQLLV